MNKKGIMFLAGVFILAVAVAEGHFYYVNSTERDKYLGLGYIELADKMSSFESQNSLLMPSVKRQK